MRGAKTLEARVAALEGPGRDLGALTGPDLARLDENERSRLAATVEKFKAHGAQALTDDELHLIRKAWKGDRGHDC